MGIEIREDSKFTFRFEKFAGLAPVEISAASITILSPGGLILSGSQPMEIDGNLATKEIDFGLDPAPNQFQRLRNYRAEMTIDGAVHNRFFDIVLCPFQNEVTDADLANEWPGVSGLADSRRGEADSGGVNYFIDRERGEIADYWTGGTVTVFPKEAGAPPSDHVTTGFSAGGRVSFRPVRAAIEAGQPYTIRRNFSAEIRIAGEIVAADLWKKEKRIGLILDGTQVSRLIIYKVFERLFSSLQRGDKEEWKPLFDRYENLYAQELGGLPLVYDSDDIGAAEDSASIGSLLMER